ncbi:MAG: type II toxin-antitoxin system RelE/ParE family toxin [Proteobacteria bacterium]|nr:type II toxin-antitoxin system RelE/ParE family toxin [Pseudomonadota bacterium]
MKLRYSLLALADLEQILDYITEQSPQGASRVHARIKAITHLLLLHPLIGSPTDDPSIRRMTTPPYPYLIFYEARDEEIIVHAMRHGARDPSGTLKY